jgi:hypothetical protein
MRLKSHTSSLELTIYVQDEFLLGGVFRILLVYLGFEGSCIIPGQVTDIQRVIPASDVQSTLVAFGQQGYISFGACKN